jgi:hypothetical protein
VPGTSLNTSQAWVAPPEARLSQALVPTNSHTPINLNISVVRFNLITLLLADVKIFFYCLRVSDTSALTHNNTQSVETNKLFYSILNW